MQLNSMIDSNIAFVGAGNMASSIIAGLVRSGVSPSRLRACARRKQSLSAISVYEGIGLNTDTCATVVDSDIVVLAVKPGAAERALEQIHRGSANKAPLLVSVVAGLSVEQMQSQLGSAWPIVRAMPNTPAQVACGVTGLYANTDVDQHQRRQAEWLMASVGVSRWFESEELLNAVTALSGSGPAYFYLLIEAMSRGGMLLGLPEKEARLLSALTALGAARMVVETDSSPDLLRKQVTSPGGTTEQALKFLYDADFLSLIADAMKASYQRAQEIAEPDLKSFALRR